MLKYSNKFLLAYAILLTGIYIKAMSPKTLAEYELPERQAETRADRVRTSRNQFIEGQRLRRHEKIGEMRALPFLTEHELVEQEKERKLLEEEAEDQLSELKNIDQPQRAHKHIERTQVQKSVQQAQKGKKEELRRQTRITTLLSTTIPNSLKEEVKRLYPFKIFNKQEIDLYVKAAQQAIKQEDFEAAYKKLASNNPDLSEDDISLLVLEELITKKVLSNIKKDIKARYKESSSAQQ